MCCPDKVHCCQSGYICDAKHGKCRKGDDVLDMVSKVPAIPVAEVLAVSVAAAPDVGSVPCPGGEQCPDRTTCCETEKGQYACCPLPQVPMSYRILPNKCTGNNYLTINNGPHCQLFNGGFGLKIGQLLREIRPI